MTDRAPIRIMIVDDHMMVRDGLKVFLSNFDDMEVVGEAGDGGQAIALCSQVQPDVILMDIVMPGMDGPAATEQILARHPSVRVIALTSFVDEELVMRAIQSGAIAYVLKDVPAERLAKTIRDAHLGRPTMDAAVTQVLVQAAVAPPGPGHDLTPREREILVLLAEGKTNREIADQVSLGVGTVRYHVSNILSKLGVNNRTEAARVALDHGLGSAP